MDHLLSSYPHLRSARFIPDTSQLRQFPNYTSNTLIYAPPLYQFGRIDQSGTCAIAGAIVLL